MKNSQVFPIITLVVIIGVVALLGFYKEDQSPEVVNQDSILGCYAVVAQNDVYTLNVESQDSIDITGTLEFKNYQKDSSSGLFTGTYKNGVLLGNYSFRSEGTDSNLQVIFKRVGDDFVRGYGNMSADGTSFTDLDNITYDNSSPLSVFKKGACIYAESKIVFPSGDEKLTAGEGYILKWSGGPDPIQIFLIDVSLKSFGASVSVVDRVYGVKNSGSYEYIIPKTTKPGLYELQIGNSTSSTFEII